MSRESFLDNVEFMELVRICVTTRCTYAEAVKVIKRAGFQVSEKTFQRAKTEIELTRKKRIAQIVDELPEYAASTIDTATAVDYALWSIVKTTKNVWEKLKALDMIMKNCGGKSSNFDASPVLNKIARGLESRKTKELESKKTEPAEAKIENSEKYGMEENT